MSARDELRTLLAQHSFLTRPEGYRLASGQWSADYFDLKRATLSQPRALVLAAEILLDRLGKLPPPIDAIGGLTSGADPLVIAVSQLALRDGRTLPAFFVRDEQKSHGTKQVIEGIVEDRMRVVILDDVMTTGGSVQKAIDAVEKAGASVVQVFILVDREEGGVRTLRDRGYAVEALFTRSELRS